MFSALAGDPKPGPGISVTVVDVADCNDSHLVHSSFPDHARFLVIFDISVVSFTLLLFPPRTGILSLASDFEFHDSELKKVNIVGRYIATMFFSRPEQDQNEDPLLDTPFGLGGKAPVVEQNVPPDMIRFELDRHHLRHGVRKLLRLKYIVGVRVAVFLDNAPAVLFGRASIKGQPGMLAKKFAKTEHFDLRLPNTLNKASAALDVMSQVASSLNTSASEDYLHKAGRHASTLIDIMSWAASVGNAALVEHYHNKLGSQADQIDQYGKTPLIWAIVNDQTSTVEFLLQQLGMSAHKYGSHQTTPLSWAVTAGRPKAVEALLETMLEKGDAELSLCHKDSPKDAPLALAASKGHDNIIRTLLPAYRGISSQSSNETIKIALEFAIEKCDASTVQAIFRELADRLHDPSNGNQWFSEWLHKSVGLDSTSLADAALDGNAEVDCLKDNKTPLCFAAEKGSRAMVVLLLAKGADPDSRQASERAINIAIRNEREDIVRLLLDAGADITESNDAGESALTLAERYPTILSMILQHKEHGKLAQPSDLDNNVDKHFEARVVKFSRTSGILKPRPSHLSVRNLLNNPRSELISGSESEDTVFRWFHLPANNVSYKTSSGRWKKALDTNPSLPAQMKWVEVKKPSL